jgi:hypothetical protein
LDIRSRQPRTETRPEEQGIDVLARAASQTA